MPRKIKTKIIKEHTQCGCGKNTSEQYESNYKHVYLVEQGYKYRVFKNTKQRFYFTSYNTICEDCSANLFNELQP